MSPIPGPDGPAEPEDRLLHDARAVRDTASLDPGAYLGPAGPPWVVAAIQPDEDSGSGTVPGGFIEAETGKLVLPEGGEVVLVKSGTWEPLRTGPVAEPVEGGDYSWTEPIEPRKRILTPEDYYSPFIHGGTILCRPDLGRLGIARFGPVCLIFPGWERFVAEALEFAAQHGGLFQEGGIKANDVDRLKDVLHHENRLIAALAQRGLIASGGGTPDVVRKALAQDDGPARAILAYLVITGKEPAGAGPLLDEVVESIRSASGPDLIRWLALGAFAAGLFLPGDARALARSKTVLGQAAARCDELGVDFTAEPTLPLMFEKMGIRD